LDHGGAGDGSGTKSRFDNVAGAARGNRRNWVSHSAYEIRK